MMAHQINNEIASPMQLRELYISCIQNDEAVENTHFKKLLVNKENLSKLEFRDSIFSDCRFMECDFTGASFENIEFKNCNFSNSTFNEGYFSKCKIEFGKAVGSYFYKVIAKDIQIMESDLQLTSFTDGKLKILK